MKAVSAMRNISPSSDDFDSEIISPYCSSYTGDFISDDLEDMSVGQLTQLLSSLQPLLGKKKAARYERILNQECIDGACLAQLGVDELVDIGFESNVKDIFKQHLSNQNYCSEMSSNIAAADASPFSPSSYRLSHSLPKLDPSYKDFKLSGQLYGQLVVLGFREFRLSDEQKVYPVGCNNDVFPLFRQQKSTGVKIAKETIHLLSSKNRRGVGEEKDIMFEKKTNVVHDYCVDCKDFEEVKNNQRIEDEVTHTLVFNYSAQQSELISKKRVCNGPSIADIGVPLKVELGYTLDPHYDMFQVGRHDDVKSSGNVPCRANDIVIKGLVMQDQRRTIRSGKGTISRFACRLLCERKTGRTYIYAGGFNASKVLDLSDTTLKRSIIKLVRDTIPTKDVLHSSSNERLHDPSHATSVEYDALLTQGIKVYFPAVGLWREISVMGRVYTLRTEDDAGGDLTGEKNELYEGCIIDVGGGVCMTYTPSHQSEKSSVSKGSKLDPVNFVVRLNDSKPMCPVLMNYLHFPPCMAAQNQALARIQRLRSSDHDGGFVAAPQSIGSQAELTPSLLIPGIEKDQQPYVFTACGHCFGYNPAFSGKVCPLCRKEGPYVPLIFPFAPSICVDRPTHVFHPCGHAASHKTCARWSQIPRPDPTTLNLYLSHCSIKEGERSSWESKTDERRRKCSPHALKHPSCPFCSRKLELTGSGKESQCFSKLVVQFEQSDLSLSNV